MSSPRKFFVIGNWKMNVDKNRINGIVKMMNNAVLDANTEAVFGCPSCYLSYAREHLTPNIGIAAQNCYKVARGNFSGEISPEMIKDCGCDWVILGHPERRTVFNEPDSFIAEKVAHAQEAGMKIIACLCETTEDRQKRRTEEVLFKQLKSLAAAISDWSRVVLAFEALWASNTGVFATNQQVQDALTLVRDWLRNNVSDQVADTTRLIYAGSVSSSNCREMASLENLDGFLVGSAALKPDIVDIINSRRCHVSELASLRIEEQQG
ncbi:triosephosphate isomerase-like [Penaeus chinensis]|uniref:triosephosphate isomerase-like n=1 Tax=Penaeus chinensis TaxID=139456 RepID=UPI001FB61212|nr:triosephosphate isomerase-like [Penaeus chinensis]